jgi:hypothetical protein
VLSDRLFLFVIVQLGDLIKCGYQVSAYHAKGHDDQLENMKSMKKQRGYDKILWG